MEFIIALMAVGVFRLVLALAGLVGAFIHMAWGIGGTEDIMAGTDMDIEEDITTVPGRDTGLAIMREGTIPAEMSITTEAPGLRIQATGLVQIT